MLRLAITPGEPGGIGPDLLVRLAGRERDHQLVAVCDPQLLRERAATLGHAVELVTFDPDTPPQASAAGCLHVLPVFLNAPAVPGTLDVRNAAYVIDTLNQAVEGCLAGRFDGLVTGPVHKGVINDAGIPFSGHTEFLAGRTGTRQVVMMLVAGQMRVALVTTHLPLREVPDAINGERLRSVIRIVTGELRARFGIAAPRLLVAGLNPHAGEGGHLGREEIDVIIPALDALRAEGLDLIGPLPADTLFTPRQLERGDAVLAMYHDQGLPVLKHAGFGHAVNVTLGLPIVRTSVDHGTALDLAGSDRADPGSLEAAIDCALELAGNSRTQTD